MASNKFTWPSVTDITVDTSYPTAMTNTIGEFQNLERAALLIATGVSEFQSAKETRQSWFGYYYSDEWTENDGLKKVYLTASTKNYLTLNGPESLPAFCAYTEKETLKRKQYFNGIFQSVDKKDLPALQACVPPKVWDLAMREGVPFNPQED